MDEALQKWRIRQIRELYIGKTAEVQKLDCTTNMAD